MEDEGSGGVLNGEQDFATFHNSVIGGCIFCKKIWETHAEADKETWATSWLPVKYLIVFEGPWALVITYVSPSTSGVSTALASIAFDLFLENGKITMFLSTYFFHLLIPMRV